MDKLVFEIVWAKGIVGSLARGSGFYRTVSEAFGEQPTTFIVVCGTPFF